MSHNRYENLSKKSPIEAAEVVCEVEKRNYLAHSIREIENALSKYPYFRLYRIITLVPPNNDAGALIIFREKCCEIILPSNSEVMSDKKVRLSGASGIMVERGLSLMVAFLDCFVASLLAMTVIASVAKQSREF